MQFPRYITFILFAVMNILTGVFVNRSLQDRQRVAIQEILDIVEILAILVALMLATRGQPYRILLKVYAGRLRYQCGPDMVLVKGPYVATHN